MIPYLFNMYKNMKLFSFCIPVDRNSIFLKCDFRSSEKIKKFALHMCIVRFFNLSNIVDIIIAGAQKKRKDILIKTSVLHFSKYLSNSKKIFQFIYFVVKQFNKTECGRINGIVYTIEVFIIYTFVFREMEFHSIHTASGYNLIYIPDPARSYCIVFIVLYCDSVIDFSPNDLFTFPIIFPLFKI